MMLQLDPPMPVETPQGEGQAVVLIDYGPDYDLLWVVFDNATGECWTWANPKVRAVKNITLNHRTKTMPSAPALKRPANPSDHSPQPVMNGTSNGESTNGQNGHGYGNGIGRMFRP